MHYELHRTSFHDIYIASSLWGFNEALGGKTGSTNASVWQVSGLKSCELTSILPDHTTAVALSGLIDWRKQE